MAESSDIRERLAMLCRSARKRTSIFTKKRPNKWSPTSICRPGSIEPFTEAGAWEFIACCLQAGVKIETIPLDKPPDKIGYVMLVPGNHGEDVYIKLEIVGEMVFGRSFHVSEKRSH